MSARLEFAQFGSELATEPSPYLDGGGRLARHVGVPMGVPGVAQAFHHGRSFRRAKSVAVDDTVVDGRHAREAGACRGSCRVDAEVQSPLRLTPWNGADGEAGPRRVRPAPQRLALAGNRAACNTPATAKREATAALGQASPAPSQTRGKTVHPAGIRHGRVEPDRCAGPDYFWSPSRAGARSSRWRLPLRPVVSLAGDLLVAGPVSGASGLGRDCWIRSVRSTAYRAGVSRRRDHQNRSTS